MKNESGIYIRAKVEGKWQSIDIADERLPDEEVIKWLRNRGGRNEWAENVVMCLLGREQIAREVD